MRSLDAALRLAGQGIASFPCNNEKRPTCPHGFKDATADPQQLRALCRDFPGVLIGVPTGEVNGFDVLDIDPKHSEAREWWSKNRDDLMPTRVHRTRSGGLHLLYRYTPGIRCSAGKLALGVDIRTTGGYIIHWPSAGYPVLNDGPISEFPAWLIKALRPPPPPPPRPTLYVPDERALLGLIRCVVGAPEGQRNATTFWAGCRAGEMVASGTLSEADAIAFLVEAASRAGLPQSEALRAARNGLCAARR